MSSRDSFAKHQELFARDMNCHKTVGLFLHIYIATLTLTNNSFEYLSLVHVFPTEVSLPSQIIIKKFLVGFVVGIQLLEGVGWGVDLEILRKLWKRQNKDKLHGTLNK